MLTSLFSLFYVNVEFHRFLHRGRAKTAPFSFENGLVWTGPQSPAMITFQLLTKWVDKVVLLDHNSPWEHRYFQWKIVSYAIKNLPSESCLTLWFYCLDSEEYRHLSSAKNLAKRKSFHPIKQTTLFHLQMMSIFLGDKISWLFGFTNKRKLLFFCYRYVILARSTKLILTCET